MGAGDACKPSPKVLNNFVTELVCCKDVASGQTIRFANPREGWIYVGVQSEDGVTGSFVEPEKARQETLVFRPYEATKTVEAMKYLPVGEYAIRAAGNGGGTLESVVVRAIPEIFYDAYLGATQLHECNDAARDWEFLEKYVNPHVNTMVAKGLHKDGAHAKNKPSEEILKEWVRRGKHWVDEVSLDVDAKTADDAYAHFVAAFGLPDPNCHGYLLDEFRTAPEREEIDRINLEALARMATSPEFAGKKLYCYVGTPIRNCPNYGRVSKFVVDHHFLLAREWYLMDRPSYRMDATGKEDLWACFAPHWHERNRKQWNEYAEGAANAVVMTLGGRNLPDSSLDVDPELDSNVLLDWQLSFLATHPLFGNAPGINVWTTSYMDEEMIRWMCRLFRHYCIEGRRDVLTADPYVLPHVTNADFEQGTEGWDVKMAGADTIRAETLKDYGKIEGRYQTPKGDHFLVMKRSKDGPNVVSQTVKHLTPGRLYTFRMYTGNYGDLKTGRSKGQKHAVSISLSGATVIPGREIHRAYYSRNSKSYAPFAETGELCRLNYHWVAFRADGPTATLKVSDWADAERPGGAIGQELVFNFFQVQPYFECEASGKR